MDLLGNAPLLTICVFTRTIPDTEMVQIDAEKNIFRLLSNEEVVQTVAQALSDDFETHIKLSNIRIGSIQIDMMLEDLNRLEYIKELSDKYVLSNILDSVLMTPEFIESCQAEDVFVEALLDEDSYQQVKLHACE